MGNQLALIKAVADGDTQKVERFLQEGLHPDDEKDESGDTALIKAAESGRLDIVKLLLEHGSDKDHRNKTGQTALIMAATKGYADVAELLLKNGANVEHEDHQHGWTAFICAVWNAHLDVTKLLLEYGVNKNHQDKNGKTAFDYVKSEKYSLRIMMEWFSEMTDALIKAAGDGDIKGVQHYLDLVLDPNYENEDGDTALSVAAKEGQGDIVELLLKCGASKDNQNKYSGQTALIESVTNGHFDIAKTVLDHGAKTELQSKGHQTALIKAAKNDNLEILELLLDYGAKKEHQDKSGDTALIKAAKNGLLDNVKILLERGANIQHQDEQHGRTAFIWAVWNAHLDVTKLLLEYGVNKNHQDKHGKTAFEYVISRKNKIMMEWFSEMTDALIKAAGDGDIKALKIVLGSIDHPNHENKAGDTALINAAKNSHADVVELLLKCGAKTDHQNKNGDTAVSTAVRNGDLKLAELISKAGANKKRKNKVLNDLTGAVGLLQSHIDSNFVFSTENFESIVERLVILEKIHEVLKRAKYVVMSTESDIATALQTLNSFMDELGLFLDRQARTLKMSQVKDVVTRLASLCNGQTTAQPGFYAPGIFVHSNSTRLHVCTGTMSNGNEGVDTKELPIGRTGRVAVRVAGGQMSVSLDGKEVAKRIRYAMTQDACDARLCVYAGDSWHEPAHAEIGDLKYEPVSRTDAAAPEAPLGDLDSQYTTASQMHALKKSLLLGTVSSLKNYEVSFNLRMIGKRAGWTNVLHFEQTPINLSSEATLEASSSWQHCTVEKILHRGGKKWIAVHEQRGSVTVSLNCLHALDGIFATSPDATANDKRVQQQLRVEVQSPNGDWVTVCDWQKWPPGVTVTVELEGRKAQAVRFDVKAQENNPRIDYVEIHGTANSLLNMPAKAASTVPNATEQTTDTLTLLLAAFRQLPGADDLISQKAIGIIKTLLKQAEVQLTIQSKDIARLLDSQIDPGTPEFCTDFLAALKRMEQFQKSLEHICASIPRSFPLLTQLVSTTKHLTHQFNMLNDFARAFAHGAILCRLYQAHFSGTNKSRQPGCLTEIFILVRLLQTIARDTCFEDLQAGTKTVQIYSNLRGHLEKELPVSQKNALSTVCGENFDWGASDKGIEKTNFVSTIKFDLVIADIIASEAQINLLSDNVLPLAAKSSELVEELEGVKKDFHKNIFEAVVRSRVTDSMEKLRATDLITSLRNLNRNDLKASAAAFPFSNLNYTLRNALSAGISRHDYIFFEAMACWNKSLRGALTASLDSNDLTLQENVVIFVLYDAQMRESNNLPSATTVKSEEMRRLRDRVGARIFDDVAAVERSYSSLMVRTLHKMQEAVFKVIQEVDDVAHEAGVATTAKEIAARAKRLGFKFNEPDSLKWKDHATSFVSDFAHQTARESLSVSTQLGVMRADHFKSTSFGRPASSGVTFEFPDVETKTGSKKKRSKKKESAKSWTEVVSVAPEIDLALKMADRVSMNKTNQKYKKLRQESAKAQSHVQLTKIKVGIKIAQEALETLPASPERKLNKSDLPLPIINDEVTPPVNDKYLDSDASQDASFWERAVRMFDFLEHQIFMVAQWNAKWNSHSDSVLFDDKYQSAALCGKEASNLQIEFVRWLLQAAPCGEKGPEGAKHLDFALKLAKGVRLRKDDEALHSALRLKISRNIAAKHRATTLAIKRQPTFDLGCISGLTVPRLRGAEKARHRYLKAGRSVPCKICQGDGFLVHQVPRPLDRLIRRKNTLHTIRIKEATSPTDEDDLPPSLPLFRGWSDGVQMSSPPPRLPPMIARSLSHGSLPSPHELNTGKSMESPTIKPLLSKSDIETAAIQIQSMFRGYHVRSRLMLLQQATECASVGVMLAFRGTKQGSSGWYFDCQGALGNINFFAVTSDGEWWNVMNQREHKAYVDNNEQLLFPTLVCQRDTKKTLQLSAGIFLEVNHPDANPEPIFWHQTESGFWERQDKTADTDDKVTEADAKAIRRLVSNVLSGSVPDKEEMDAMREVLQAKAASLRKRKKKTATPREKHDAAPNQSKWLKGPRANAPATTKKECWFCKGSGTMDEYAESLQVPSDDEGDDDDPECLVCWGPAEYGLSTECTHWFCSECLRMSLETILEEGKFPAFCPSCYSEALEQDQKPAAGRIEDSTLTFLQRSGVISRELQFRFMQQQARASEGPLFFRCPAKCGNHLLWEKVGKSTGAYVIEEGKSGPVVKAVEQQPGVCPCGALVCMSCQTVLDPATVANHKCGGGEMGGGDEMDDATLRRLKQLGKECPNCGNFIEKTGGCHIMMCGGHAHGSLVDAIRRGGCGHQFDWNTMKPIGTFYIGVNGTKITGIITPGERRKAMEIVYGGKL